MRFPSSDALHLDYFQVSKLHVTIAPNPCSLVPCGRKSAKRCSAHLFAVAHLSSSIAQSYWDGMEVDCGEQCSILI